VRLVVNAEGEAVMYFNSSMLFPDQFIQMVNSFTNETRMAEFEAR